MSIYIESDIENPFDFDWENLISKVVNQALDFIKCPYETEVNVLLTDNSFIQNMNRRHRDIDKATDVLSFPLIEYESSGDFSLIETGEVEEYFNPEKGELMLGDMIISVDKVMEQADKYGHSIQRELGFLVAHSMLHLFGYDHMEDDERLDMENKQKEILNQINLTR